MCMHSDEDVCVHACTCMVCSGGLFVMLLLDWLKMCISCLERDIVHGCTKEKERAESPGCAFSSYIIHSNVDMLLNLF
jgi:hypothetical protein